MSDKFLLLPFFIKKKKSVFNANSVNPDQTPRSAASNLDLHYLPMSLLWDVRHKWVNSHVLNLPIIAIRFLAQGSDKVVMITSLISSSTMIAKLPNNK